MTDTMTSQNIDLSSWDTLYILSGLLCCLYVNLHFVAKHLTLLCINVTFVRAHTDISEEPVAPSLGYLLKMEPVGFTKLW
jgi:hypothetical protein